VCNGLQLGILGAHNAQSENATGRTFDVVLVLRADLLIAGPHVLSCVDWNEARDEVQTHACFRGGWKSSR